MNNINTKLTKAEMKALVIVLSAGYASGKEGTITALINDHQYKANFRIDKEINTMSLINNLIINKNE